jgi:carbohydrate-binding DOMON domain-containing protein
LAHSFSFHSFAAIASDVSWTLKMIALWVADAAGVASAANTTIAITGADTTTVTTTETASRGNTGNATATADDAC